ncbi:MAG: hypothetical protein JNK79_07870 [Chitinophagaceae bacterium]|nr:hypothetical protein [Chitinophagaceae bacterium]
MLKRYLPYLAFAVVVVACDKNKLETRPSLKIKNVNTSEVFPGQQLIVTLEYKDKEGDLGNGFVTYVRNRLNGTPLDPLLDKTDTVERPLPDFPKTTTGDIEVKIDYAFMDEDPGTPEIPATPTTPAIPAVPVNDTMIFKFYVKDAEGNVSDTLSTGTIVERAK